MTAFKNVFNLSIVIMSILFNSTLTYRIGQYSADLYKNIQITAAPTYNDVQMGSWVANNGDVNPEKCFLTRKGLTSLIMTCELEEDVTISCEYVDQPDKQDPLLVAKAGTRVFSTLPVPEWIEEDFKGFPDQDSTISMKDAVLGGSTNILIELTETERESQVEGTESGSTGYFFVKFPYIESGRRIRERLMVLL